MNELIIECKNLTHKYGDYLVYENLNFSVEKGKIFGLLGKNGMGKTTTINIMMGFLRPTSGSIKIFGEDSHKLSPATRSRIGLLHEGHLAYEFFNVEQAERFYSRFFPKWERNFYYDMMDKMGMNYDHKISKMSCGQRSQVVLGLIMAQVPDLMILDDYSMGLDAGYRRLFIDYLKYYVKEKNTTVLITSHIIQDLEKLIDDTIIIGHQKILLQMDFQEFLQKFHQYQFTYDGKIELTKGEEIANFESLGNAFTVYSFLTKDEITSYLSAQNISITKDNITEIPMTLEDAFIGLTGKY
jgi:ABC-2 type transport system ATP-binding protein